jgi:cobalamin biosynthesis Mg chelatase CobN
MADILISIQRLERYEEDVVVRAFKLFKDCHPDQIERAKRFFNSEGKS